MLVRLMTAMLSSIGVTNWNLEAEIEKAKSGTRGKERYATNATVPKS